jgi:ABC-2 type transport system permease protein
MSASGVIHDIGYRGYDGSRLARRGIGLALFRHTLRGTFGIGRSAKSKVVPVGMVVVMLLPAIILAVVTVILGGQGQITQPPLPYTRYAMVTQAAIAIFLAISAPQAVSLDLRFHTLPLYLSRPLARVDYVRAKLTALATATFILIAAPLLVMYLGALLAEFDAGAQTLDVLQALLGALAYSVVLSSIALVIASWTKRRGFGIAAIITVFALSYGIVSGLQGMALGGADTAAGWIGLLSPMTLVDGIQVWALGAASSSVTGPPGGAGAVFLVAGILLVAACYRLLVRRYRKVLV